MEIVSGLNNDNQTCINLLTMRSSCKCPSRCCSACRRQKCPGGPIFTAQATQKRAKPIFLEDAASLSTANYCSRYPITDANGDTESSALAIES